MYKYNKLRGRIVEKYGTLKEFAKAIGLSQNSLGKKLNCQTQISQSDVEKWCKLLEIAREEIPDFFYPRSWTTENL